MADEGDYYVQPAADKSRFMPLTKLRSVPRMIDPVVYCAQCPARSSYEDARLQGWTFDPEGTAFHDFYCKECSHV